MRTISFFIIVAFGLLLGACGEEDRICTPADFLGTFTGTTLCSNGGVASDSVVIVTAGSGANELDLDLDGIAVTVEIDGCSFNGAVMDTNADLVYEGELNGDEIEVTTRGIVSGFIIDCTATGVR